MSPKEEVTLSAGESLVAQGAMVLKAENDSMTSIALARPRDEVKVKARALAIIEADPEAAASAYYSIPFKEHSRQGECTGLSDDSCPVKEEVEGIGIEGAREIARLWENNSSRVYFTDEDDDWVYLSGVFLDLETNVRTEVPLAVSKVGRYRSGEVYRLYPQKLAQAISAGVSKVARNAIVQAVPRHISRAVYEKAKEIVVGSGSIEVPKLVEAFATFNVTREQLEGFYGMKLEELSADKRRHLRGLFTAFRERLREPEEFFGGAGGGGGPQPGAKSGSPGAATQTASGSKPPPSATAGEARVTGGTQAPTAPAAPAKEPTPPVEGPKASTPTPHAVDSQKPNEPEPTQADFDGLGI